MFRLLSLLLISTIFSAASFAAEPDTPAINIAQLKERAEKGEAAAQAHIGYFLLTGSNGMARNETAAFKWYYKAAQQGYPPAQYNLGVLFFEGRGIQKDDELAYFWLHLAAATGRKDYMEKRDEAGMELTLLQVAEIKKRAASWKPMTSADITSQEAEPVGRAISVPWIKVPAPVQKAIAANVEAGDQMGKVDMIMLDGKTVYRAIVSDTHHHLKTISVRQDGSLIEDQE